MPNIKTVEPGMLLIRLIELMAVVPLLLSDSDIKLLPANIFRHNTGHYFEICAVGLCHNKRENRDIVPNVVHFNNSAARCNFVFNPCLIKPSLNDIVLHPVCNPIYSDPIQFRLPINLCG